MKITTLYIKMKLKTMNESTFIQLEVSTTFFFLRRVWNESSMTKPRGSHQMQGKYINYSKLLYYIPSSFLPYLS